ncbi:Eco57I restriction-modification methylase domain-containing protein [Streptomyces sp. NPDC047097]|uniref:Eco57I restriction-modification methylase domain-containing protein n=1 Tax=Streptomyces sp. NPDC047097 TaxID=3155260 RepID=UPI0033D21B4A
MAPEAPTAAGLVLRTEARRQEASLALDPKRRAKWGQYFTPAPAADFIASLARLEPAETIRILDPGAGAGSLTASIVMRILREQPGTRISVTACEIDEQLHDPLATTLADCVDTASAIGGHVEVNLVPGDFVAWATADENLSSGKQGSFDLVIMNPPYKKLAANSRERRAVTARCTETSNLYSAFMALGIHLLAPRGQLVAITPRSFANGPYFRPFRRYFLDRMQIDRVHLFEMRNKVFADANVLQENVIFSATRTETSCRGLVTVSTSQSYSSDVRSRTVHYEEMVYPDDSEYFIHISTDEEDTQLAAMHEQLSSTLTEVGCQISTGRVVDFRSKDHLRPDPVEGSVPLIYPLHMRNGGIVWPAERAKKNNAIMLNSETEKMTFPSGFYVVVKRLSSKEERRRVVASVYDPDETSHDRIGFENHVNVFHSGGEGVARGVARGLCLWLNSTLVDRLIRRFSGHTQVNATDLRNLRYPSKYQLDAMGRDWPQGALPEQDKVDDLVERHLRLGFN